MNPVYLHALWLAASPLVLLIDHMIFTRLFRRAQNQLIAVAAILFTYLPLAGLLWRMFYSRLSFGPNEIFYGAIYDFLTYSCIGYAYFHVFNMSETARRIRILREIYMAGTLTPQEIIALYGASDVIEVRIERLLRTRQIAQKADRYVVIGRGLYIVALIVQAWRSLLGFEPFDQLKKDDAPAALKAGS